MRAIGLQQIGGLVPSSQWLRGGAKDRKVRAQLSVACIWWVCAVHRYLGDRC